MNSLVRLKRVPLRIFGLQIAAAVLLLATIVLLDPWPTVRAASHFLLLVIFGLLLLELRQRLQGPQIQFRNLWQLLVVAVSMWAMAHAYEAAYLIMTAKTAPTPSVADLLRLAGTLAAVAALAGVPVSEEMRFGRLRDVLEVILLVASGLALFWFVAVEAALEVGIADLPQTLWAAFPPAFGLALILLSARLILLESRRQQRTMLFFIGLSFLVRLSADLAYGYLLLQEQPLISTVWGLGRGVAPLLLLTGSSFATEADQAIGSSEVGLRQRLSTRAANLLPSFLTLLIMGFTVVDWLLTQELNWAAAITSLALGLLLVARQGVVAGQAEMRQYASLVGGAADLAFVCDAEGELLLSNPAMRSAIGWQEADRQIHSLIEVLEDDEPRRLLEAALRSGWSGEVEFRREDGATFPVALSLRPVMDELRGEPVLVATAHDLTIAKARQDELQAALDQVARAREALEVLNQSLEAEVQDRTQALQETVANLERANRELKELDRLKSEFVALVSHELRGPLTNIRSGVELALSRGENLPDGIEGTLNLVASETERLVSFVEIILDLSALEAGRFPLSLEPAPMAVLTRTVMSRFPADVGGDRIQVDVPDDLPPVLGDERSIMSVLFHLLDNSLKYAPEGPITVRAQREDMEICLSVSDQGPGIPPDQREVVFQRFHRLDSTDSREVYGHGLGLHLARRLIEAMGGSIQVGDAEGGGTQVSFRLPLCP